MGLETITADDLFATSTKKRCQDVREHFIGLGKVEEHDRIRRHPDTCQSRVFTMEEADALWATRHDPASLLGDMGMCIYSFGPVLETKKVFLTDDSSYGWKVLKEAGWMAMSYRFRGTAHQEFNSWRDHVAHFYGKEAQVVESVEDLLRDLNGELVTAEG